MAKKKFSFGKNVNFILSILLIISLILYFSLRFVYPWVRNILPDIMSIGVLTLLISLMIDNKTPVDVFLVVFGGIFMISVGLFVYGINNNVRFLIDISPEFIGVSLVTFIVAFIKRRKILV